MRRKALIIVTLIALAFTGFATAAVLTKRVTLRSGQCITLAKTKVCAPRTKTVTNVHTVTAPAETVTVTKTTTAATPAATPADYSGNGGLTLPPIAVTKDATLSWTCDGGYFGLSDSTNTVFVNSQASSGSTFVRAGTYTIEVNAIGNWTIHIA